MAKYTTKTWIAEAERKYPGKFSYEETRYVDSYHKINIKCLEHNKTFQVGPIVFLRSSSIGKFCPDCRDNLKMTSDEFLQLAKEHHPLLDFSKTKYKNQRSDVLIVCPIHGSFTKKAKSVLHGQMEICPECIKENNSQRSFDIVKYYTENLDKGSEPGTFYKLLVTHKPTKLQFIKIGFTSKTSFQRYDDGKYKDFDFEVIDEIHTTNLEAAKLELEYKRNNKSNRFYLPKYIWFAGRNELYEMDGYHQLQVAQIKFIRDSLLVKQEGKCPLCMRNVEMPTLDHYHGKKQHGSGLVRGVICNTCNRMAGVVENNLVRNSIDYSDAPSFLRNLADYIEHRREKYIHPTERSKSPKLMKSSYNKLVKVVNGKQKVPAYTGKFTKGIEKLFDKYGVEPQFHESSTGNI